MWTESKPVSNASQADSTEWEWSGFRKTGRPYSSLKDLTRATACFNPTNFLSPSDNPIIIGALKFLAASIIARSCSKLETLKCPMAKLFFRSFNKISESVIFIVFILTQKLFKIKFYFIDYLTANSIFWLRVRDSNQDT